MSMELFFNSAWVLVAIAGVCLWLISGRHTLADRRISVVALVMLMVVLFPVISVSDDLWSAQNPAETDTCQRRIHCDCGSHSPFSPMAALPEPAMAGLSFGFQRFDAPLYGQLPAIDNPALHPVENRPPPAV